MTPDPEPDPMFAPMFAPMFNAVTRLEQRLAGFYAAVAITALLLIVVPGVVGLLRVLP